MFFERLLSRVRSYGTWRVAVAVAESGAVLAGAAAARDAGVATPILFGDPERIRTEARGAEVSLEGMAWGPATADPLRAAVKAVRTGQADVLLKGAVDTPHFLQAILDHEVGLRDADLLTHMAAFALPERERPLFLTDSGMIAHPDLEQKVRILANGIRFLHRLGYAEPRVALLSASETPDPRLPSTTDAVALKARAEGGALGRAVVDGPMALDLALSERAARIKHYHSPVAGRADLLICPDVVAGNLLGKSMLYLARARGAGLVLGATHPIVMLSRADDAATKLRSLVLAAATAQGNEDA